MSRYSRTLCSSLLLLSLNTVDATPPSTPTLDVRTQGVNVDAEWSATGATGYRLFYTNSATGKVEMADMGAMNQISAVMEDGTALSIYVQAYNADGDSPYSEVKSFVVNDPVSGKTPEMLKPEAQALAFQAVSLDTPVAFLPTAEDVAVQERTVRSSQSKKTYGPEFEDGRISMTVHIAPALVQRDLLELSLCLGVADTCEPLLVWNSEEQEYTKTITIRDLPNDVEKSVYLELLLPKVLVEKLRAQSSEEQEYVLYASDVNSVNPTAKNVQVAKIPVVNLGGQDTRRSTRGTSSLKITTPQFGKDFSNAMFGVKFNVTPQLWIYKTYATAAADKKAGAQLGATGTVSATVMGNKFDIMTLQGFATKNSGKRLTRKVSVNVLGKDIYTNWQSKKPKASSAVANAKDTAVPDSTNWQICTNDPTAQCSEPPATDDGDASNGSDGDEASPLNNIYSYTKTVQKGYSQIYVIVFVPVKAELGVSGTAELNVGAAVEITVSPVGLKVTGGGGPKASIGGYANAGVTILIASAGIQGTITLITDELQVKAVANLAISPFNLIFGGSVTNQLNGPSGNVGLYATYYVPAWALPPWKEKKATKNLVSWSTFSKNFTLLSWGSDGTQQPRDPNSDLANSAASTGGEYVPVFTDTEPTSADGPSWVCIYGNLTHKAPVIDANGVPLACNDNGAYTASHYINEQKLTMVCTQMPVSTPDAKYEEVAFNVSTMDKANISHKSECPAGSTGAKLAGDPTFDWMYVESWSSFVNAVTALKVWGPLRMGLFEGVNRTGSSAYWYTNSNAVTSIDLNRVPANYMLGKSGSILMTRIGMQDAMRNPTGNGTMQACFYQNSGMGGQSFCLPLPDYTGTKPLKSADNKNPRISESPSDGFNLDVSYVGDWWNDTISSVSFNRYGLVCTYQDSDFKGFESCYVGQGNKFSFDLAGQNDKISSMRVHYSPYIALIDTLNGSLQDNGTSSLPNSNLLSSGKLSGLYAGGAVVADQVYSPNTASVAAILGPGTYILHANSAMNGKRSMFFLDNDHWDVTYLNGIDNDVEAWWHYNVNCNVSTCNP